MTYPETKLWNRFLRTLHSKRVFRRTRSCCVCLPLLAQVYDLKLATSYCFVRLCRCAVLNGAFLGVVVYSLFYIGLEPFAGCTWCLSTGIPCWLTATAFSQHVPYAWAYAIGVHALSWWAQIHVGHIMLEHRKPALLDSFFQVLVRK